MLWALIPVALIVVAIVGMAVLEPEHALVADGQSPETPSRPAPPPGVLLLAGLGVRRLVRGIANVCGGLFEKP
jgi:hypothetical protein